MVLGPPRARRRRGREQGAEGELLWGGRVSFISRGEWEEKDRNVRNKASGGKEEREEGRKNEKEEGREEERGLTSLAASLSTFLLSSSSSSSFFLLLLPLGLSVSSSSSCL
jgi:hypothetical protein